MALEVAVQMDANPIDHISTAISSFALMLEAQARGATLFYYEPRHLGAARTGASSRAGIM